MYGYDDNGYDAFREMIELDRIATGANDNYDTLADLYDEGEPMSCRFCGAGCGPYDPAEDEDQDICRDCRSMAVHDLQ